VPQLPESTIATAHQREKTRYDLENIRQLDAAYMCTKSRDMREDPKCRFGMVIESLVVIKDVAF